MVLSGVSIGNPTIDQLVKWGADNAGDVLLNGQWWRIVTAMFVHVGIIHLATNMWCLWNLALLAEPLMGSVGVFAVYILTGAAGNLLSVAYNWYEYHDVGVFSVGAGASGAVFGIAGALIVLLKSDRLPIDPFELKRLRKSVIYFAVLNLVISFGINFGSGFTGVKVDNAAHVGGCLCGFLFAAPMVPRIGSSRDSFRTRLQAAIGMVVLVLTLFAYFLTRFAG
jgi:rhomboid protease GluP